MEKSTKPRTYTVHGIPARCPGCKAEMPRSVYAAAQLAMGNPMKYQCPECGAEVNLQP